MLKENAYRKKAKLHYDAIRKKIVPFLSAHPIAITVVAIVISKLLFYLEDIVYRYISSFFSKHLLVVLLGSVVFYFFGKIDVAIKQAFLKKRAFISVTLAILIPALYGFDIKMTVSFLGSLALVYWGLEQYLDAETKRNPKLITYFMVFNGNLHVYIKNIGVNPAYEVCIAPCNSARYISILHPNETREIQAFPSIFSSIQSLRYILTLSKSRVQYKNYGNEIKQCEIKATSPVIPYEDLPLLLESEKKDFHRYYESLLACLRSDMHIGTDDLYWDFHDTTKEIFEQHLYDNAIRKIEQWLREQHPNSKSFLTALRFLTKIVDDNYGKDRNNFFYSIPVPWIPQDYKDFYSRIKNPQKSSSIDPNLSKQKEFCEAVFTIDKVSSKPQDSLEEAVVIFFSTDIRNRLLQNFNLFQLDKNKLLRAAYDALPKNKYDHRLQNVEIQSLVKDFVRVLIARDPCSVSDILQFPEKLKNSVYNLKTALYPWYKNWVAIDRFLDTHRMRNVFEAYKNEFPNFGWLSRNCCIHQHEEQEKAVASFLKNFEVFARYYAIDKTLTELKKDEYKIRRPLLALWHAIDFVDRRIKIITSIFEKQRKTTDLNAINSFFVSDERENLRTAENDILGQNEFDIRRNPPDEYIREATKKFNTHLENLKKTIYAVREHRDNAVESYNYCVSKYQKLRNPFSTMMDFSQTIPWYNKATEAKYYNAFIKDFESAKTEPNRSKNT